MQQSVMELGPQGFFSGGNFSLIRPQKLNFSPIPAWNNFIHYPSAWILPTLQLFMRKKKSENF